MKKKMRPSGSTSNTQDCFLTFVGARMKGYFRKGGDSFVIFEDGRALVFHHETGAYWVATKSDVERELDVVRKQYERDTMGLANVLELAGSPTR